MQYADIVRRCYNENILFSALLELTYRCNLDCVFCYNDRELQGRPLSLGQYHALLEDLSAMGTLNLALSGGEPLAHPSFFQIGAKARELGFVVRVKSNGHALRARLLKRLKAEVDPYSVDLSLHGAAATTHDRQTRVPGSFERLMANLREMQSLGIRVKLNVPLTRWNEHQIDEIFAIADDLGIGLLVDSSITPRDNGDRSPLALAATPEGLVRLQEIATKRLEKAEAPSRSEIPETLTPPTKHCGSGSSTVTLDPYGNVYPCVQLRRAAGNLHQKSIKEIWHGSPVLEEVRALTVRVKQWIDGLGPSGAAMGFCPGTAHVETGNPAALYPLAKLRQEIAQKRPRPGGFR